MEPRAPFSALAYLNTSAGHAIPPGACWHSPRTRHRAVKNSRISFILAALVVTLSSLGPSARPASAQILAPQDRLCDPTYQDCRADILKYIQQETVQIDMGFWMMTDARYSNELVKAWARGVKIRLLMDPRCGGSHTACNAQNDQLAAAGIPMRNRITSGILH